MPVSKSGLARRARDEQSRAERRGPSPEVGRKRRREDSDEEGARRVRRGSPEGGGGTLRVEDSDEEDPMAGMLGGDLEDKKARRAAKKVRRAAGAWREGAFCGRARVGARVRERVQGAASGGAPLLPNLDSHSRRKAMVALLVTNPFHSWPFANHIFVFVLARNATRVHHQSWVA